MQGHPDVIDYLNTLLTGELAARDQYFIHSRMYEDWGFTKLYRAYQPRDGRRGAAR